MIDIVSLLPLLVPEISRSVHCLIDIPSAAHALPRNEAVAAEPEGWEGEGLGKWVV